MANGKVQLIAQNRDTAIRCLLFLLPCFFLPGIKKLLSSRLNTVQMCWCSLYAYPFFVCRLSKIGNLQLLDQLCRIMCKSQFFLGSTESQSSFPAIAVNSLTETLNCPCYQHLWHLCCLVRLLRRPGNYYAKALITNYKITCYLKFNYKSEIVAVKITVEIHLTKLGF